MGCKHLLVLLIVYDDLDYKGDVSLPLSRELETLVWSLIAP